MFIRKPRSRVLRRPGFFRWREHYISRKEQHTATDGTRHNGGRLITTDIVEVYTAPTSEPVTLDELKGHLRTNTGTAEDAQLTTYLKAARQQFEFGTDGRVVMPTTFRQHLTQWPEHHPRHQHVYHYLPQTPYPLCPGPIRLLRGQVTSVTSVTYYDPDDQPQTLTVSSDLTSVPALVWPTAMVYPLVSATKARPITVQYVAGYANAGAVPDEIKLAIMLLAGHWYTTREAFSEKTMNPVPMGFQRICDRWKTGLVGW